MDQDVTHFYKVRECNLISENIGVSVRFQENRGVSVNLYPFRYDVGINFKNSDVFN